MSERIRGVVGAGGYGGKEKLGRKKEETRYAQVRRQKDEGKKLRVRTTDFGEKPPSRKVTARQGASEMSLVD